MILTKLFAVQISFSQNVDSATIKNAVTITKANEQFQVPFTVRETGMVNSATLLFSEPLDINTDYQVYVSDGITDLYKNKVVANHISITTGWGDVKVFTPVIQKSGKTVTYTASLSNHSTADKKPVAILVIVDENGELVSIDEKEVELAVGAANVPAVCSITATDELPIPGGCKAYGYIWDSLDEMNPYYYGTETGL